MSSGVGRFLVTASPELKMDAWLATGSFANWLESRENGPDLETSLVTVFEEDREVFLTLTQEAGVTVEEIHGGGDTETYVLLVGEPGSGWRPNDQVDRG